MLQNQCLQNNVTKCAYLQQYRKGRKGWSEKFLFNWGPSTTYKYVFCEVKPESEYLFSLCHFLYLVNPSVKRYLNVVFYIINSSVILPERDISVTQSIKQYPKCKRV